MVDVRLTSGNWHSRRGSAGRAKGPLAASSRYRRRSVLVGLWMGRLARPDD